MAGKVAIVGVSLLVACKGAPKGDVSATQRGDQVVIEVHTDPDVSISIPAKGVEASSSSEHRFPATL